MHTCAIYKYIILICELRTTNYFIEKGTKTALKKLKRLKKAQGSRKSQDILSLGCLFKAGCICKKAGSICKKISQNASVSRLTLRQRIVR